MIQKNFLIFYFYRVWNRTKYDIYNIKYNFIQLNWDKKDIKNIITLKKKEKVK